MLPSFRGVVKRPKPIVVHLGNVGFKHQGEISANRTLKFASRFKDFHFFGIDLRPLKVGKKNWTQMQTDMLNGLQKFKDNSVSLITSEMTLGYYGSKKIQSNTIEGESRSMEHAFEVMKEALRKLKPHGKLIVTIDSKRAKNLILEGLNAGFTKNNIHQTARKKTLADTSFWTRHYSAPNLTNEETRIVTLTFQKGK